MADMYLDTPRPNAALAGFRLKVAVLIAAMAVLGAWFLFTLAGNLPSLAPQALRIQSATDTKLYLDDFVVFYAAGSMATANSAGIYSPAEISQVEAKLTGQETEKILFLPFFNPPSSLRPLAALAVLPLGIAAVIWSALGLGAMTASLVRIAGDRLMALPSYTGLLWIPAILSSAPLYHAVVHGQMTLFLVAGFALVWAGAFESRRPLLLAAGLLLISFKPALLVGAIAWIIARGNWRPIHFFLAAKAALVLAALAIFGFGLASTYFDLSLQAFGWDDVNGISSYGMFGWNGLLRGIIGPEPQLLRTALMAGLSIATVAWLVMVAFDPGSLTKEERFGGIVAVTLLVSPHSYSQDLLLLLPPLLVLATGPRNRSAWALAALAVWFASFFHFDVLAATGVGPMNLLLIASLGVFTYLRGKDLTSEQPAGFNPEGAAAAASGNRRRWLRSLLRPKLHLAAGIATGALLLAGFMVFASNGLPFSNDAAYFYADPASEAEER